MALIEHPVRYLILLFVAAPIAVFCAAMLLSALVRAIRFPACPHCLRRKVRPSKRISFLDHALPVILVFPFRCDACLKRFYAFGRRRSHRLHRPLPQPDLVGSSLRTSIGVKG